MQPKDMFYSLCEHRLVSTWSQKDLISASDDLRKDSIGALREMIKVRIPTITKQTLRYELGFSRI